MTNHNNLHFNKKKVSSLRDEQSSHAFLGEGCKKFVSSLHFVAFANNF